MSRTWGPWGSLLIAIVVYCSGAFVGLQQIALILRESHSASFAETFGTVTYSEVVSHSGRNGVSYSAAIHFAYTVNGAQFESLRDSYSPRGRSNQEALKAVRDAPVGARVLVHYDPENPSDGVLLAGIQPGDIRSLMFWSPAFLVSLWGFGWIARWVQRRWFATDETIVRWRDTGDVIRVRLGGLLPSTVGVMAGAVVAFFAALVLASSSSGGPTIEFMAIQWALAAGVGLAAWVACIKRIEQSSFDLTFNRSTRLVEFPGEGARSSVKRDQIARVSVERTETNTSRGGRYFRYTVFLVLRDGTRSSLVSWEEDYSAERLARLLGQKLGLTLKPL